MATRFLNRLRDAADALTFIFRDEFITADPAPVSSPRTAEPGPGTLTVVDTNNVMSISAGSLAVNGTPGASNGLVTAQFLRAAGKMFYCKITDRTVINTNVRFGFANSDLSGASIDIGFDWSNATTIRAKSGNGVIGAMTVSTATDFAFIMRGTGGFLIYKNTSGDWDLLWVYNATSTAQYAKMRLATVAMDYKTDSWRAAQLPAPWNADATIYTDTIASPSATDTFTHEADCLIEFEATTLPSGGNIQLYFRTQDASNFWEVRIPSDGSLQLFETVGGTPALRGNAGAGTLSGGERIVIVADDETITGYYDNTQAWTYAIASNFKTETDGSLPGLGTGGAISTLITWPRTMSGALNATLDKYTQAYPAYNDNVFMLDETGSRILSEDGDRIIIDI